MRRRPGRIALLQPMLTATQPVTGGRGPSKRPLVRRSPPRRSARSRCSTRGRGSPVWDRLEQGCRSRARDREGSRGSAPPQHRADRPGVAARCSGEQAPRRRPATVAGPAGRHPRCQLPSGSTDHVQRALSDARVCVSVRGSTLTISPYVFNTQEDVVSSATPCGPRFEPRAGPPVRFRPRRVLGRRARAISGSGSSRSAREPAHVAQDLDSARAETRPLRRFPDRASWADAGGQGDPDHVGAAVDLQLGRARGWWTTPGTKTLAGTSRCRFSGERFTDDDS